MHRGGRAGFRLKLADGHGLSEDVFPAGGRPFVGDFGDGRGRGDGINGRYIAHGIGHVGCGGVAVHGLHFLFGHSFLLAQG
jgi:hypothetical protein